MARRKRNAGTSLKIAEYEVEDIGVEHSQYFQGRGTSFSDWDVVEIGIGETFNDALEDALEMLSQAGNVDGADLDRIAKKEKLSKKENGKVTVSTVRAEYAEDGDAEDGNDEDENWYHVAVYVKWSE